MCGTRECNSPGGMISNDDCITKIIDYGMSTDKTPAVATERRYCVLQTLPKLH
jgi:hypothetical protein